MRQTMPRTRWQRLRHALAFGLPLALLELGLFAVSMAYSGRLLPPQGLLIGVRLYLVVPAIAGYWRYRQGQHEGWESGWAGFRVGFVGFAVSCSQSRSFLPPCLCAISLRLISSRHNHPISGAI